VFLKFLQERNPALIECASRLLAEGRIEPDSYVLDLDSIEGNADRLLRVASDKGVAMYFMAKQIGRNPEVARRVLARRISSGPLGRFKGMVAVDFREARVLHDAGLPVRHVGHLVQVPEGLIDATLDMEPEVITVYSLEKAESIARHARARGLSQGILLKICGQDDTVYKGQEGGFTPEAALDAVLKIRGMEGVRFSGVTSFPCFLFDAARGRAVATPNAGTLAATVGMLLDRLSVECGQVNMPSCSSLSTIPLIPSFGGTHAEPGHGLTGTNPDNPLEPDPLVPAVVYVTEVSHRYAGRSLCFGGGHYRRSNVRFALVSTSSGFVDAEVEPPDCPSIDYHFCVRGTFPVGAPVLMSFRTQIFVTRSRVVLVEGLSSGNPALVGVWDSQGGRISQGEDL
jgi:predicted amino acid racemase